MDSLNILTISGWTQPADALDILAPSAQKLDYIDHTPESVLEHRGHYDLVIGWSLGGVIARRLLASGAISARGLVSLAAPYQFVRGGGVHEAMPRDIFEQFYDNFQSDTPRTASRFHGLLLKGDSRAKEMRAQLSHHPRIDETTNWLRWMDFLRDYSAEKHDYSTLPSSLVVHGAHDAIIPAAQGKQLAEKIGAALLMLPEAGHAVHLHAPEVIRRAASELVA